MSRVHILAKPSPKCAHPGRARPVRPTKSWAFLPARRPSLRPPLPLLTPPTRPQQSPLARLRRLAHAQEARRLAAAEARRKEMRAVVQRVLSASVEVEGQVVSAIGPGLLVLVGVHEADTSSDADYICRKVLNMRLFTNEKTGKAWDQSVMQRNFDVLLVSQFTLYGILKGNKPDFHVAMPPAKAKPFYASLVEKFQKSYKTDSVKDGIFGAMMKVSLVNDGPVTMQVDSPSLQGSGQSSNGDAGLVRDGEAAVPNEIR